MREIIVTKAEAGQRFDRFLGRYLPEASSGFIHKMLRKKNIKLNAGRADGSEKIKEGDAIQIFFAEETLRKFTGEDRTAGPLTEEEKKLRAQVRLLYSSDDVLIFHKPAGMLTQKAKRDDDSLNDYLLDYCRTQMGMTEEMFRRFRPSVANRLDRNTSGIVLCGVTTAGLQELARLLRERGMEKYYLCIVQGALREDRKIRGWLYKDEKKNTVTLLTHPAKGAEPVETWYQVLAASSRATLLKVRLITGKSHQIRAHLASEGHPVLGDYKYGSRKENDILKRTTGINYQMLHSYEIRMPGGQMEDENTAIVTMAGQAGEPDGKKGLHVIDPPPEDFVRAMEMYGLSPDSIRKKTEADGRRRRKTDRSEENDGNMDIQRTAGFRPRRNGKLHK